MIRFIALNKDVTGEHLGLIPTFLSADDEAPASEQFHNNYAHGGGWQPMEGWTLNPDLSLEYKETEGADPPLKPYAVSVLREETIIIYPYAWVVVVQPNGDFEVSRMD